ncbi:hypothetical protein CN227_15815 [Sinorhizobium meliloti]|nr:hypothetical protein CN240_09965 [Sinorhizobium meliloti]RVG45197.1 hypothetical protein CN227_15815 [Sinorhizobium meliloti]RVO96488.1 hypothetical protein CN089_08415 [Sinorhizobium meliloti]RVQ15334.1 hypothetical protein CN096_13085 [Sinorhizobium meliloti]
MRVLSQYELACCTKAELSLLLHEIAGELPNLPEGSVSVRIASSLLPRSCCTQHDRGISARRAAAQARLTISPASSASGYGRAQSPCHLLAGHRSRRA